MKTETAHHHARLIQSLDPAQALMSLNSRESGLNHSEVQRRLAEFGPNVVATREGPHWSLRIARNFTHFFALVLWLAAALAFVAEHQEPGTGMGMLGIAIIGVIIINGLFSFWQEYRAGKALQALQQLLPREVKVMRDGVTQSVVAAQLVPGDLIYLVAGDLVPADCRLIDGYDVKLNLATVSGESFPQRRTVQASAELDPLRSPNLLLAGTTLVAGEAKALIFATGMQTEFGRIAQLAQTTTKVVSPLQMEIMRLSRWVALLATALGVLFFIAGQLLGLPFWPSFIFAIGIIVAMVPEGLLPTVTLALAMGAQRMARRNAMIRHLPSVETLGCTTVICTDKTGTLTQNALRVHKLYLNGAVVDANRWQTNETMPLFEIAAHCHSLAQQRDPLEEALVAFAQQHGVTEHLTSVRHIPFDSERSCMSTLHQTEHGLKLYTKGSLEALLKRCTYVDRGDKTEPLSNAYRNELLNIQDQLAHEGLRVIAMAWRSVPPDTPVEQLEESLVFTGLVGLDDPIRPEVPQAVAQCHSAGIKVIMVTGDHPLTALAVARNIGLVQGGRPIVISGEHFIHMRHSQLQLALDAPEILFARVSAEQKLRIVAALKRKGEVVAVTGDGVNDAPALRAAHIGIAMGRSGSDVAKESADMVLLDDNFASIVAAVEEGRAVFDNIRKFLTYILTSNIPEIIPYLAFALWRIPLPLTVIQILAVDLGTDIVPALALGAERPAAEIMQQPPRRTTRKLVDWPLIARAYLFLGVIEAVAAMAAFFLVLQSGGWRYGEQLLVTDPLYLSATTACLMAIVVMQVVNVWLCRSERNSIISSNCFTNPLIFWGIAFELLLIIFIVYTQWGNAIFGTTPISASVWLFVAPFAVAMFLLEELRKLFARRKLFQ